MSENQTFQFQTTRGLILALVNAINVDAAKQKFARANGCRYWSEYVIRTNVVKIEFDGNFRVIIH